jgi:hypothetical protein
MEAPRRRRRRLLPAPVRSSNPIFEHDFRRQPQSRLQIWLDDRAGHGHCAILAVWGFGQCFKFFRRLVAARRRGVFAYLLDPVVDFHRASAPRSGQSLRVLSPQ